MSCVWRWWFFLSQFQSFSQYRCKTAKKTEEEIEFLRNNPKIWNVHSVLNVLHSLVDKSNINRQLEVYTSGGMEKCYWPIYQYHSEGKTWHQRRQHGGVLKFDSVVCLWIILFFVLKHGSRTFSFHKWSLSLLENLHERTRSGVWSLCAMNRSCWNLLLRGSGERGWRVRPSLPLQDVGLL